MNSKERFKHMWKKSALLSFCQKKLHDSRSELIAKQ
jgi:hypothetical protein